MKVSRDSRWHYLCCSTGHAVSRSFTQSVTIYRIVRVLKLEVRGTTFDAVEVEIASFVVNREEDIVVDTSGDYRCLVQAFCPCESTLVRCKSVQATSARGEPRWCRPFSSRPIDNPQSLVETLVANLWIHGRVYCVPLMGTRDPCNSNIPTRPPYKSYHLKL